MYGELCGGFDEEQPRAADDGGAIHKRLDVFTEAWVGIAPARNTRPLDSPVQTSEPEGCPFCPGGARGAVPVRGGGLRQSLPVAAARPAAGSASRRHDRSRPWPLRDRPVHASSRRVLRRALAGRAGARGRDLGGSLRELWADPAHEYVFVFENRGAEVGATIAHPHGQIYAIDDVPPLIAARDAAHRRHRELHGSCLSCTVTAAGARSSRVISASSSFVAAVPFAARWPYEVAVRARRHGLGRLADLEPDEQRDLAVALRDVALRYDALFDFQLPYMMVALEAPRGQPDWHLAFELYPIQRAAGATKIRASVETALGLFLNDVLPEEAAAQLATLDVPAEPIGLDELYVVTPANQHSPVHEP